MINAEELSKICQNSIKFTDVSAGIVKINTPFLDSFNDEIAIYAINDSGTGSITLTDDGWTIDNLESRGIYLSVFDRKQLEKYGVTENNGALQITTTLKDFPVSEYKLLHAMLVADHTLR